MGGGAADMEPAAREVRRSARRVVTYDARGTCARRALLPKEQTLPHHVADAQQVVAATSGGRAVVAGVSMGAAVSIALAMAHPDAVAGIAVIAPGFNPAGQLAPTTAAYIRATAGLVRDGGFDAVAGDPAAAGWARRFSPAGLLAVWDGFPPSVEPVAAGAVAAPVIVIGWPEDGLHPIGIARDWADHLGAPLEELPPPDDATLTHAGGLVAAFVREVCS
jgi:pimeloyl-ACP methyl ester carboxylesterase